MFCDSVFVHFSFRFILCKDICSIWEYISYHCMFIWLIDVMVLNLLIWYGTYIKETRTALRTSAPYNNNNITPNANNPTKKDENENRTEQTETKIYAVERRLWEFISVTKIIIIHFVYLCTVYGYGWSLSIDLKWKYFDFFPF